MRLVPSYFKPFLFAEIPRSNHMLDASNFLLDITVPSFIGKCTNWNGCLALVQH